VGLEEGLRVTRLAWRLGYVGWALIGLYGPSRLAVGLVVTATLAYCSMACREERILLQRLHEG
jgi:hypothetical protein